MSDETQEQARAAQPGKESYFLSDAQVQVAYVQGRRAAT